MYSKKLHCNDYHGPPWFTSPNYVSLDDEREMAMINMGGPSLYGGYLQTKVIILMNLSFDMVNLDLVLTQFHFIIIFQDSRGNDMPSFDCYLYTKSGGGSKFLGLIQFEKR